MIIAMSPPTTPPRRSSLGLIVLWLLVDSPMHVYRMQKLIESQGKDRVVNVRARASLYQAIDRLVRHGLVEVAETVRIEGYPDRIVYAITETGREVAREWLREMLSAGGNEYPEFLAAVSILFGLPPEEAQAALELRAEELDGDARRHRSGAVERPSRPAAPVPAGGGVPQGGRRRRSWAGSAA